MNRLSVLVVFVVLVLALPAGQAAEPAGSAYLVGEKRVGVVLCHGRGQHPTWKVVDPLRKGINEALGYHTLSIQMPNDDKDWKRYADDFPEAYDRIAAAVEFLREEAGVERVFLVGHSMGARMASAYVAERAGHGLAGLVVAGCRNNGPAPLDCRASLAGVELPVLDIWGGRNDKDSRAAAEREGLRSASYSQVEIAGANHKFEGHDDALVAAVTDWLKARP